MASWSVLGNESREDPCEVSSGNKKPNTNWNNVKAYGRASRSGKELLAPSSAHSISTVQPKNPVANKAMNTFIACILVSDRGVKHRLRRWDQRLDDASIIDLSGYVEKSSPFFLLSCTTSQSNKTSKLVVTVSVVTSFSHVTRAVGRLRS